MQSEEKEFTIVTPARSYRLRAETAEEKKRWVSALREAVPMTSLAALQQKSASTTELNSDLKMAYREVSLEEAWCSDVISFSLPHLLSSSLSHPCLSVFAGFAQARQRFLLVLSTHLAASDSGATLHRQSLCNFLFCLNSAIKIVTEARPSGSISNHVPSRPLRRRLSGQYCGISSQEALSYMPQSTTAFRRAS